MDGLCRFKPGTPGMKEQMKLSGCFENKILQNTLIVLFVTVMSVFCIQMYGKAYRPDGNDFTSYLLSAKALLGGGNPYDTGSPFVYIYPLFLAFVLIPLSFLPYWLATLVWYLLNLSALIIACDISIDYLFKQWGLKKERALLPPVVIMLLLMSEIIQNHLLNGQVNFIVAALMVLFFKYFHYRNKKRWWAALFLAMAISIKLVPLILIGYILFRKDIKFLTVTIGITALLAFLPYILVGNKMISYYTYYFHYFLLKKITTTSKNFFTGSFSYSFHHFLSSIFPSLKDAFWAKGFSVLAVLTPIAAVEIRRIRKGYPGRNIWIFNLYLVAILLITPISETHHLAFYIPAVVVLGISILFKSEYGNRYRLALFACIFAALLSGSVWNPGILYFISIALVYILLLTMVMTEHVFTGNE
jgi:hypothetical protein